MVRALRRIRWRRLGVLVATTSFLAGLLFISWPLPDGLTGYNDTASLRVYDRHGTLLREFLSPEDGAQTPLTAGDISDNVRQAFLAAEDSGFYLHAGVSPTAILRALWQNVKAGRVLAGGSTISQQLARTLRPRPRTLLGKVHEAMWALRLEMHLSKSEILTQYLNRVAFGNTATGIESAAHLYFGKRASALSVGQAALLASLPRGPTAYNPYRHPEALETRRQWVLSRLQKTKAVSAEQVATARSEPVDLSHVKRAFLAPHFVQFVRNNIDRWGLSGATEIHTSLDLTLQQNVETIIATEVSALKERNVGNAAALVVDNVTNEVLAYQGSLSFFDAQADGQVDGIHMLRQPGSALKPFVYAEAFRQGFTPATVLADIDTSFASVKGSYAPKNYDRRSHGPTRAREALANSFNVPAIRVANAIGVDAMLRALHQAGFESLTSSAEHYGLGLALGNGEVSLWEAARAYAGMSRAGVVQPLRVVLHAFDAKRQEVVPRLDFSARRFADSKSARLVTHILSDNAARAQAFGFNNALRHSFPVAAKTGTSKGYSDNWTVGFTHERTVAVWAGNFDGTPMVQVSGVTGAGPIFKQVMIAAMAKVAPAPLIQMNGLTSHRICPLSGQLAAAHCPGAMTELFVEGTAPHVSCEMHRALREGLSDFLKKKCFELAMASGGLSDLGVEYYDWAQHEGVAEQPWLTPLCLRSPEGEASRAAALKILHPEDGAEFVLFADLPLSEQSIPFRMVAPASERPLKLMLDGDFLQTLDPPFAARIQATAGHHVLSAVDSDGSVVDTVKYVVRAESNLAVP
jgi:penicillin-binding protein 1C